MSDKFLVQNPTIVLTEGALRGIIVDLSIRKIYFAPNSLLHFLRINDRKKLSLIYEKYEKSEQLIITEYIEWLSNKNIIFLCENEEFVSNIRITSKDYLTPHLITNCIYDVNTGNLKEAAEILSIVSLNRIPFVELRIFDPLPLIDLFELINKIQVSDINNVVVIMQYNNSLKLSTLRKGLKFMTTLSKLVIYESIVERNYFIHDGLTEIIFTKANISSKSCGKFDPDYFFPNSEFYSEGLKHNSCLNRKISIDRDGNVKNCPSMPTIHGNIFEVDLSHIISKKDFKKYWHITKENIDTCKICEFRSICQDCRAYVQQPDNILSKPLKCGYDPYTNKWEDWSTNPLSKIGIEYYGLQELVKTTDE